MRLWYRTSGHGTSNNSSVVKNVKAMSMPRAAESSGGGGGGKSVQQGRRKSRFYCGDDDEKEGGMRVRLDLVKPGDVVKLGVSETTHACTVLRMKEGDALELCDGRGVVVGGVLLGDQDSEAGSDDSLAWRGVKGGREVPSRKTEGRANNGRGKRKRKEGGAQVVVDSEPVIHPPPRWQWTVAVGCGSLKGGRGDWLVEKCAELGATGFVPLLTQRSPVMGSKSSGGNSGREDRWERLAWSAMKQSLQTRKMKLHEAMSVKDVCAMLAESKALSLIGAEGAMPIHLALHSSSLSTYSANTDDTTTTIAGQGYIIVGPEGDFTAEELQILQDSGAQMVGLGPHRLRTETASIAMLSYCLMATSHDIVTEDA